MSVATLAGLASEYYGMAACVEYERLFLRWISYVYVDIIVIKCY